MANIPNVNWSNVNNLNDFMAVANQNSSGFFWTGMVYMAWFVLFILMIPFGPEPAILVATFIAMLPALMLVYLGLMGWQWFVAFPAVILFVIIWMMWGRREY